MKTQNAHDIITAAQRVCTRNGWRAVNDRLDEISSAPHYCEPGYSTSHAAILFGNWNDPMPTTWDGQTRKHADKDKAQAAFFAGVVKALEAVAELEWSDEWQTCSECGGAIRTSADSYGWQRSYVELDGEIICRECAAKRASEILASFENEDSRCLTADLGIDPAAHDYTKLPQEFENGLYGGQDASPPKIAAALRARGISRFLFLLDSVGQFDMRFSVWVHADELENMPDSLSHAESASALDPAEGLRRALQSAPMPSGEGITYVKCNVADGTSTARKVSPEEFIQGIK